ncbi:WhiB family transcriptional regulator [Nocardia wallacei]|uniref:WhiB family transcriptional regulator n=1 Tax=Nocardia wallacei TaxID=480035 RepID=UPI0024578A57|nr:WhiB family transcriptional regulator [Nocardia wallacei]
MESLNAEWRLRAKCRGHAEPDLWFPMHRTDATAQRAIFICTSECAVRRECGEDAADHHERHAVRAGFFTANADDWRSLHLWLGRPLTGSSPGRGFREVTCTECGKQFGSYRAMTKCSHCQQGLVPAGPVWQQIEALRAQHTLDEIAALVGLAGRQSLQAICRQQWVHKNTAARIGAVAAELRRSA